MKHNMILNIHMITPIIWGVFLLAILIWALWPKKGLLAIYRNNKKNKQRVLIEDALKYLFDCEYRKAESEINGLAGNLNISVDEASEIIAKLLEMELIHMEPPVISLTDMGRSYALRVIRIHRIWERYLADETSFAPGDWHTEACKIEHQVTIEDAEKLASQMGNPVFDPHGDPIPTSEGLLPKQQGKALHELNEGDLCRITHIEDEPKNIFEQLSVLGLYPGMQLYITDIKENKITFAADGDELVLTPFFASYITVEKLKADAEIVAKQALLSSLKIGEEAEVIGISPNCRGQQRRRLMDMGIVPGSHVHAIIKSASGDPTGYRVLGTTVGIRKQHADLVFVKPV